MNKQWEKPEAVRLALPADVICASPVETTSVTGTATDKPSEPAGLWEDNNAGSWVK